MNIGKNITIKILNLKMNLYMNLKKMNRNKTGRITRRNVTCRIGFN
ncbi:hypothetical protein BCH308197_2983 [Bacillus cereus H3081.97]|nr:hypothetical protein BCH308197_2983 [Bacillus cereus H3081.97]KKZ90780.1 hypothetical protein B4086_2973 [Bacillus cereus]